MRLLFCLLALLQNPAGPRAEAVGDPYADYEERLKQFAEDSVGLSDCNVYLELLRLEFQDEANFCSQGILDTVDKINRHSDTIDFDLAAMGWIVHRFWDSPLLTQEVKDAVVGAVTNVTLWYGDPGYLGDMQYWSENHQIGWNSAEYLIGSAFAMREELTNIVFQPTGLTGAEHAERGKEKVVRWMNKRLKYGFSEFNSDTYGKIALKGVMAVAGAAPDPEVQQLARIVMNLQLYDFILGAKDTKLVTARGRAYAGRKLDVGGGVGLLNIITGAGAEERGSSEGIYYFLTTLSGYSLPPVYLAVHSSIQTEDHIMMERFGLGEYEVGGEDGGDAVNCTFWFGNGGYFSPVYPRCFFIVGDTYDLWDRQEVFNQIKIAKPLWDADPQLIDTAGEVAAPFGHGPVLGPANMLTFRSPGLMLSSVQDYKGGYMAGQQHAWQATLDTYRYGTIFTTQPTSFEGTEYWEGGILPKIGQFGSTLISMYNPEILATVVFGINMTHAHLRVDEYDEIHTIAAQNSTHSSWRVARQNDSYVAIYSWQEANFKQEEITRDLVAHGQQNVWICEVGSKRLNGSFEDFVQNIAQSEVKVNFTYDNSLGECLVDNDCLAGILQLLECMLGVCSETEARRQARRSDISVEYRRGDMSLSLDWFQGFFLNGNHLQTSHFPRYRNLFGEMEWGDRQISIQKDNHFLFMDFDNLIIQHS